MGDLNLKLLSSPAEQAVENKNKATTKENFLALKLLKRKQAVAEKQVSKTKISLE